MEELTQEELKRQLHYDPNNGLFTWNIKKRGVTIHNIAGCICSDTEYIILYINNKRYRAHRLIWLYIYGYIPSYPEEQIDHINHIRSDNRLCNLQLVSRKQNNTNKSKAKNNTSGTTGVYFKKSISKWYSILTINREIIQSGYFNTIEEAIQWRKGQEIQYGFHENHGS